MILLAVAAQEHAAPLFMPNWAFALTAFIIAVILGVVTWSFRDVANRHAHRVDPAAATQEGDPSAADGARGH